MIMLQSRTYIPEMQHTMQIDPTRFFMLIAELALQTHHVYSMSKRRGNNRFHVVSTWNTYVEFVGKENNKYIMVS